MNTEILLLYVLIVYTSAFTLIVIGSLYIQVRSYKTEIKRIEKTIQDQDQADSDLKIYNKIF